MLQQVNPLALHLRVREREGAKEGEGEWKEGGKEWKEEVEGGRGKVEGGREGGREWKEGGKKKRGVVKRCQKELIASHLTMMDRGCLDFLNPTGPQSVINPFLSLPARCM